MFTPPNENLLWAVHRFRSTFVDSVGNSRTGCGTGFWLLANNDKNIFITNKHNVDASLLFGISTNFTLLKTEIELRHWTNGAPQQTTTFFIVSNLDCIVKSNTADCALLISPQLDTHNKTEYPIASITKYKDLANLDEFQRNDIKLMETAMFIGFPGTKGQGWCDETWKLPIARSCTLASWPAVPFTNQQIKSSDVLLVSGLSFSGSSGSPVFVYSRGISPGGDIKDKNWRPVRLIGIMSGHFWDDFEEPQMFTHSGLSYLTRSTTIIEILTSAGISA